MNIAVISITEKGRELSIKISRYNKYTDRFCFYKHCDSECKKFSDLQKLVSEIFNKYDAIIFVCACGIAVRMIAPHIKSKLSDPAIIVIDDCGKFTIPILSGHIGKANELAKQIAEKIESQAVITTATDTGGKFSPDSFASANNLIISDFEIAKKIASAILDREKIGFISDYKYINLPDELEYGENFKLGISISRNKKNPFELTLNLIPRNIVIGIGCKRNTDFETIENTVKEVLCKEDIEWEQIFAVATIDLKSNEKGIIDFCDRHKFEFHTYSASELSEVKGNFSASSFVKDITGTDNVCERSAVKLSGGKLIVRKFAKNGVTVALAEKPVIIDFERKLL